MIKNWGLSCINLNPLDFHKPLTSFLSLGCINRTHICENVFMLIVTPRFLRKPFWAYINEPKLKMIFQNTELLFKIISKKDFRVSIRFCMHTWHPGMVCLRRAFPYTGHGGNNMDSMLSWMGRQFLFFSINRGLWTFLHLGCKQLVGSRKGTPMK